MSKYLVTWVDQLWKDEKDGIVKLLHEKHRTQVIDNFEPTQYGIRKFEKSQEIDDKERGLYWTALVLSFSKLEE